MKNYNIRFTFYKNEVYKLGLNFITKFINLYKGGLNMDYISVYEVSKKLSVSHTTVYNKLKNDEVYKLMKPFIKKVVRSCYVRLDGVETLRKFINFRENSLNNSENSDVFNLENPSPTMDESKFINFTNNFTESLQTKIEQLEKENLYLKSELNIKNNQLDKQHNHIEQQAELIKNSQILLLENQKKISMLEAPKKTFFQRIFNW